MEIWKDVVGYEGIYSVSSLGKVKSHKEWNGRKGKILIPGKHRNGYCFVVLQKSCKGHPITVHKLVTGAFLGLRPKGFEVNHKDTNKKNNKLENLEYVTSSQNKQHAIKNNTFAFGSKRSDAKLNEEKVVLIRSLYAYTDTTQRKLGKQFGVSQTNINSIVNNKSWRHV